MISQRIRALARAFRVIPSCLIYYACGGLECATNPQQFLRGRRLRRSPEVFTEIRGAAARAISPSRSRSPLTGGSPLRRLQHRSGRCRASDESGRGVGARRLAAFPWHSFEQVLQAPFARVAQLGLSTSGTAREIRSGASTITDGLGSHVGAATDRDTHICLGEARARRSRRRRPSPRLRPAASTPPRTCAGSTSACTSSMPSRLATHCPTAFESPMSMATRTPRRFSSATASTRLRPDRPCRPRRSAEHALAVDPGTPP